jgi:tRNA modification GTPase
MKMTDTIAAFATPAHAAGMGVIRISGTEAQSILLAIAPALSSDLESRKLHYTAFVDPRTAETVDHGLAVWMPGPHTYTGEHVVELHCHGGSLNMGRVLRASLSSGARTAEPGEFTRRAFLNGKMDLAQAEAILDVVDARTETGLVAAQSQLGGELSALVEGFRSQIITTLAHLEANIDFVEEDVPQFTAQALASAMSATHEEIRALASTWSEGRLARTGIQVAIAGRPNAGKSSLFNAMLRDSRAIVTPVAGTTRDYLEEDVDLAGLPVVLVDTAGLRTTTDPVESEGVARSHDRIAAADLVIWLHDGTERAVADSNREGMPDAMCIDVRSKSDLPAHPDWATSKREILPVSAETGSGLSELVEKIGERVGWNRLLGGDAVVITRERHLNALESAAEALQRALTATHEKMPWEIVAAELQLALEAVGQIAGHSTIEDVLDQIFREFCIGK